MIKFFRKIRQELMETGKTGKYLKYAISEIVLVVIGILIALSLNNWNQKQIEKKQMSSFLLSVKEDLKKDTLFFGQNIKFFDELVDQKKSLLTISNFDNFSVEKLYEIILPRLGGYTINSNTFNKIKSSGITQISENERLSERIYIYHTNISSELNDLMVWDLNNSTTSSNYWHFGQNLFEFNLDAYDIEDSDEIINFQSEATNKENLVKLISEPQGRNHLKGAYVRKQIISRRLREFKERASQLIVEIEKEFNKD